jgi:beta-glucosidase
MFDLTDSMLKKKFPANFKWGVATAAFQIEGGGQADGKGPSIWDRFCEQTGAIADGSNGLVACDHYTKWRDDIDMISELGVNTYRLSISWPRVQPKGQGDWNSKGLDFYDRIIDTLFEKNIEASVTFNHWDLPDALQQMGGWANRETVNRFVDYAQTVARRIGDRVHSFTTHNEPWVIAQLGHETGIFAPGIKHRGVAAQVSHHLLLSHGLTLQALRAEHQKAKLGIVLNLAPMHSATESAEDLEKTKLEDGRLLRWYMDPLFKGHYPADVLEFLGHDAPQISAGDMAQIQQPLDFLGVNYYSRSVVSASGSWDVEKSGLALTDMQWEVYPQGLTELLVRLHRDYTLPDIYITENGAAFKDEFVNGGVRDENRIQYLQQHITALAKAMDLGVPIAGYMVWSLMDNFEWASGYEKRFGIVHIDYETQKRTLKDSALWLIHFLKDAPHQVAASIEKSSDPVVIAQES